MIRPRLIPILLIEDKRLIKTFQFKKPMYLGDPMNTIKIFNEKYADELIILDKGARRKGTPDFEYLSEIASEAFMPLSYGGAIKSLNIAEQVFRVGFEKVILSSLLFDNPNEIKVISNRFGSQSVVVQINVKKNIWGKMMVFDYRNAKCVTSLDEKYISKIIQLEVGEIVLNFVDQDGMATGIKGHFVENICKLSTVPVIVSGGLGNLEQMKDAFAVGASAVAGSRFFCLQGTHLAPLIKYPSDQEILSLLPKEVP